MENKYKSPKIGLGNVVSFTCSDSAIEPILELLNALSSMGEMGVSRDIIVDWNRPNKVENLVINFDGDGKDRLENIIINGLNLREWQVEWQRLRLINLEV